MALTPHEVCAVGFRHCLVKMDDMADTLGISSSYLSRLFKKETGGSLQDFINGVRVEKAANLLIYSGETLPGIAEYVNFPSQSYFGKIFKQKMQMTPKQYREVHKPAEFYDHSAAIQRDRRETVRDDVKETSQNKDK